MMSHNIRIKLLKGACLFVVGREVFLAIMQEFAKSHQISIQDIPQEAIQEEKTALGKICSK